VIGPGVCSTLYHAEEAQEDFLVLRGACTAIVEEQELVNQWDLVHCPPRTRHVFVNEGAEPCVLLMVGARTDGGIRYPVSEVALRHVAGVAVEARSARDAYATPPPGRPGGPGAQRARTRSRRPGGSRPSAS
jgi:uncharacterized cupin superfamily protein